MESMSTALKQELHSLVDALPEQELHTARRFLAFLRDEGTDPYAYLDDEEELDEVEREKLHASLERGLEQMRAGQGRPAEELLERLRARE